jgi:hypothetical protein
MNDDQPTITDLLRELHPEDSQRARDAVNGARQELQHAAEQLAYQLEATPDALDDMTLADLGEFLGTMRTNAETLRLAAERAAVALDDMETEAPNE